MKSLTILLAFLLSVNLASARDFLPESHLENIPAGDSSIQQCYVFHTTPGVGYTVESSNDLVQWTTQDEIYGLGHEYVVTMREFTPAPPPPPGTPPAILPPRSTNVSLRMQPASGEDGGTIVSWASLDDGGPVIVRIAGELSSAWYQVPLYANRFGNYNYLVWHPGDALAPPESNPPLGIKDTAMLAALETDLAAMNTEVEDSLARARNAPAPAPPDPNSKCFWRIHVNAEIDTDQDGSPDWAEFEIAARGTGILFAGVTADPFNGDTNGDGIPDGEQLDADLDGTADAKDPDLADNTVTIPIGPLPRYALFPITNAGALPGAPTLPNTPIQISDKGTVLFRNGTWAGGVWTPLPILGSDASLFWAGAINDHDQILGEGSFEIPGKEGPFSLISVWPSPAGVPASVSAAGNSGTVYAVTNFKFGLGELTPGPVIDNEGRFLMPAAGFEENDQFNYLHHSRWQVPPGGGGITEESATPGLLWNKGGVKWGGTITGVEPWGEELFAFPGTGVVTGAGTIPNLPFVPMDIITPSGGPLIAIPRADDTHDALALIDGTWQPTPAYAKAIDISSDGTAIGQNHDGLHAPIYLNGKWTDIRRAAPDLPGPWGDDTVKLLDTTLSGWILAKKPGSEDGETQAAVLLPLRAEGYFFNQNGIPVFTAAGVDDVSIGVPDPVDAAGDRIWIMAPKNGSVKTAIIHSPVNANTEVKLSATGVSFGGEDGTCLLNSADTTVTITGETAETGTDIPVTLTMGEVESLSFPLGVKVMKKRVVNVTVHYVPSLLGDQVNEPNFKPTEVVLEKYLNDIYLPQINASFDVTIKQDAPLVWDVSTAEDFGGESGILAPSIHPGDGELSCLAQGPNREETIIDSALRDNDADINVYILGGGSIIAYAKLFGKYSPATMLGAYGLTRRDQNMCFIDGDADLLDDLLPGRDTNAELMHAVAHEIGHIILADGHPDQGKGVAPLPGLPPKAYQDRLMVSGSKVRHSSFGYLLVKGEWDAAEVWLKKYIDNRIPR